MKAAALLALILLVGVARPALADRRADAKKYFDAGAAAYTAGDYQAAIQAFDSAYAINPLPAIAFSLAQAERRQYFASHDLTHLDRSIELFKRYLAEVPLGGRRADATDALAQLEPLSLANTNQDPEAEGRGVVSREANKKTRLMVRCQTPDARISLDGAPAVASPLIVETAPGPHRVHVNAPGFFPDEQRVIAIAGELIPIEFSLAERPAVLMISDRDGADVYIDGLLSSAGASMDRLELSAGQHWVAFSKKGRLLETVWVTLAPGEMRHIAPRLSWTRQRVTAVTLLAISGATLATGLVFTGLALHQQGTAQDIANRRESAAITPRDLDDYDNALESRDRFRIAATAGFVGSAACLLTGLLLYEFDDPAPRETTPRTGPRLRVAPSAAWGEFGIGVQAEL